MCVDTHSDRDLRRVLSPFLSSHQLALIMTDWAGEPHERYGQGPKFPYEGLSFTAKDGEGEGNKGKDKEAGFAAVPGEPEGKKEEEVEEEEDEDEEEDEEAVLSPPISGGKSVLPEGIDPLRIPVFVPMTSNVYAINLGKFFKS